MLLFYNPGFWRVGSAADCHFRFFLTLFSFITDNLYLCRVNYLRYNIKDYENCDSL